MSTKSDDEQSTPRAASVISASSGISKKPSSDRTSPGNKKTKGYDKNAELKSALSRRGLQTQNDSKRGTYRDDNDAASTVAGPEPPSKPSQNDAATSCKIVLDQQQIITYSNTILSYTLTEEKVYALLISDKHQYIFTDCALISIKSGSANKESTTSRYPSTSTSRLTGSTNNPSTSSSNVSGSSASGMRKQQIKRYDYADFLISHTILTTPSFSHPVSDGMLEFRMNRQPVATNDTGNFGNTSAASITGISSINKSSTEASAAEKKSYEVVSIDIKRSDWSNKIKILYRTLISLQRCQKRLDSAFELEKQILTRGMNITFPAQPGGTDINYYPEYSDFVLAQQRQQNQYSNSIYTIITNLTESSLTRYKPMSFRAVWEENVTRSLGIGDTRAQSPSPYASAAEHALSDNGD